MHFEMWWPRLFRHHGEIAWDDYEKDYSDLPEEVLSKHRWLSRLHVNYELLSSAQQRTLLACLHQVESRLSLPTV